MKNKTFCEILAISIGLTIIVSGIAVGEAYVTSTEMTDSVQSTHIVIQAFDQNPAGWIIPNSYEWVMLYNPIDESVNISGWTISSIKYYGGRSFSIKNIAIPPKNYLTFVPGKQWLHDTKGERIILKDAEGNLIDETLVAYDDDDDNRYYERHPVGVDTDSDSDWRFGLQTLEKGGMRKGTVKSVYDGDTILISPVSSKATELVTYNATQHIIPPDNITDEGKIYTSPVGMAGIQSVRLVGIDAPELKTKEGDILEEGNKSRRFLDELCGKKEVVFDIDDCRQYDQYDRILAMVYANGTNLNQEMLKNGSAIPLIIPPSEFVPYANFTYSPLSPIVNQSITFDASSSWTFDPDAVIMRPYEWDFGDGTNGTGKIVNHTYPLPGSYVVSLKVTDSDGDERRSNIRNKTITVMPENKPPIASFIYSPPNPIVNQTITFDGSNSTDPDGTIEEYEWDFGDGEKAEGSIVTHSYSFAGNYTVKLTVTDDKGAINSTTELIPAVTIATTVLVKNPTDVSEGENFTATVNIDNAKDLAILLFKLT